MEIDLKLLEIQNPWWGGQSLKYDSVIENFNSRALHWRPDFLDRIELRANNIYAAWGARGMGKTVALKLMIEKLIENKKIDPQNILYYSCHNINSYEQLNEIIKIFLADRRLSGRGDLYIFVDEITLVKDWAKGIDHIKRAGLLKNVILFLSGSMLPTEDIKKIKIDEQKIISSLSFSEFVNLLNPKLAESVSAVKTNQDYEKIAKQLDYYLDVYFLTGGFISAINDFKERGAVRQSAYSNYFNWLEIDIAKLGRDLILCRQILEQIILNLDKPVGYKTIARKTKSKTHLTVEKYIDILESMFALKTVFQINETGKPAKTKAKKIYFYDPFIFWVFYSFIHGSLNYWQFSRGILHQGNIFIKLVENVIFSHLIKSEETDKNNYEVMYWRDNIKKIEIDFLVKNKDKVTPILIRYNGEISEQDKKIFSHAGFKEGIIISGSELNLTDSVKIMPLSYFLLFYK